MQVNNEYNPFIIFKSNADGLIHYIPSFFQSVSHSLSIPTLHQSVHPLLSTHKMSVSQSVSHPFCEWVQPACLDSHPVCVIIVPVPIDRETTTSHHQVSIVLVFRVESHCKIFTHRWGQELNLWYEEEQYGNIIGSRRVVGVRWINNNNPHHWFHNEVYVDG